MPRSNLLDLVELSANAKMKQRWAIVLLTLAGVGAVGGLLVVVFGGDEPVVRGKPASYWVGQLGKPGANQTEARAALGEAGSALVPFLLEDVRGDEPLRRSIYRAIWSHLPA